MGEVRYAVLKLFSIAVALLCIIVTVLNVDSMTVFTNGLSYIVGESAPAYCYMLSDNVCLTTINGISNVYINMQENGYSIYSEDIGKTYIDVIFVKEGFPTYRYYYTMSDGRLTFFCDDYENSFTGEAYIHDKKD